MLEFIGSLYRSNPFVVGGASVAGLSFLTAQIRTLPSHIWGWTVGQLTTELRVFSDDMVFEYLDEWLSKHPSTEKMRRVGVTDWYNRERDLRDFGLTPGAGLHVIWHKGRPFAVHRHIDDTKGQGGSNKRTRSQTLTITTPGRDQEPLRELLKEVHSLQGASDSVQFYTWHSHPVPGGRRRKRSLDTIFIDQAMKQDLRDDVDKFLASREQYAMRGTPWRRTYLLEGPPGTGKSSTIFAMASYLDKPVLALSLASVESDQALLNAVNDLPHAILVLEDIDRVGVARTHDPDADDTMRINASTSGITQQGLLNALDGVTVPDGRITFISTNYPERLDPTLLREGRVDRVFHLGPATAVEAEAMFRAFRPGADPAPWLAEIADVLPCSQAKLQGMLLRHA